MVTNEPLYEKPLILGHSDKVSHHPVRAATGTSLMLKISDIEISRDYTETLSYVGVRNG